MGVFWISENEAGCQSGFAEPKSTLY